MEFKSKIRDLSLQIEEITYEKERKEKKEKRKGRKGRKEKGEEKGLGKVVEVNFYALSSFSSGNQGEEPKKLKKQVSFHGGKVRV